MIATVAVRSGLNGTVDLARIRREYQNAGIDLEALDPDPLLAFAHWVDTAVAAGCMEPNAMVLSTIGPSGQLRSRTVLLKEIDYRGLVFFTNYLSTKGRDLARSPQIAVTVNWLELHRQVNVTGHAERLDAEDSDRYFALRPRASQLGAWASLQSQPLASRADLERRLAAVESRFGGVPVPRPPHWGGYRIVPDEIELWQGRQDRLHDRVRYWRDATGGWARGYRYP